MWASFFQKKFSIPKCGETFVLKSLGKKWKDYKCQLKGDHIPKYKTKDALLKNRPSRVPRDQWSGLVSYWLSDKAKTSNGIEPTRAEVFLLTHKKRVDGRPLDDDLAKAIEMINEDISNSEGSTDQPPHRVPRKGDVYSQALENKRSGCVGGLGLGPTPSTLWGSRSFLENIDEEDSSNEIVQRLEQEIKELKVHDADSGHGQIAQTRGIPSVVENTPTSHGITYHYPSVLLFELLFESKFISIVARP
ncbi:hypothetical protein KY285_001000 [Solanum tuberosum]|nr:hypothetical protein KY285_001000 [Solanum tuberosum]